MPAPSVADAGPAKCPGPVDPGIDRTDSQPSEVGRFDESRASSTDSVLCRICQSSSDEQNSMISPCLCKGTMKYVHQECLELWLNRSGLTSCELCLHTFQTHETLRYGCCESVLVWYRNPDHRNLLMSDLMIYFIMSFVCFMLTLVSVLVLRFQDYEHNPFAEQIAKIAAISFLSLVILAYVGNVLIIARDHIFPWYRWWKSARCVRLSVREFSRYPDESV